MRETRSYKSSFVVPVRDAEAFLFSEYSAELDDRFQYYFVASGVYPRMLAQADFAEGVADISPNFVKLLNQSLAAESHNLDQIVGIGLRKALEYLTKDYCVRKHPTKEDEIKAAFLGKCISDFVTDPNIQNCAKRAAWLGNDETHYTRVWTDHDINDLKILIRLTQNWISNELLTQKYLSEMPEPAKKGT